MSKKNILTRGKKQQALTLMQQGALAEAKPLLEQVCRSDRSDAEALFMLGIANGMLGQHGQAEQAFRQILKLFPQHPDANNNLGLSLEAQGQAEEASVYFAKAVQLAPDNASFVFNYANACESLGKLEQAKELYEKAIALQANYPEAWCNLGNVLQEQGEYADAIAAFHKAIAASTEFVHHYPQIYINLGNALMELGRDDEAIAAYQHTIEIRPDYVPGYNSLGNAYLQQGRKQEAIAVLQHGLALDPAFTKAYRNLAEASHYQHRDADVEKMETLYADTSLKPEDKMNLAFSLGKIYSDLKNDERAFAYYLEGNRLKRGSIEYSLEQDRQLFSAIKQVFTMEFIQRHAGTGCDDATPIFIVGMPRSGTSLVEQILASHSQVYGAGELNHLGRIVDHACADKSEKFPQGLTRMSDTELTELGPSYLARVRAHSASAQRVTDKMPHNFLYLGLIHLILPKAKIIHCQRNPIDNALSMFKTLFTTGPASHAYAYDLVELGEYFRLYQDLMAHWRTLMPTAFYDLRYEDLISDQESQTRRLLAYCDLPWEDACLEFHRTRRVVRTASLVQVRQPIHANSVEGWRRYARQMQPFIDALGEGADKVRTSSV